MTAKKLVSYRLSAETQRKITSSLNAYSFASADCFIHHLIDTYNTTHPAKIFEIIDGNIDHVSERVADLVEDYQSISTPTHMHLTFNQPSVLMKNYSATVWCTNILEGEPALKNSCDTIELSVDTTRDDIILSVKRWLSTYVGS